MEREGNYVGTPEQNSNVMRGQLLAHFGEVPQCDTCRHLHRYGMTCDAYPDSIPGEIITNGHDHHHPFDGDHGILYKEGPSDFEHPYKEAAIAIGWRFPKRDSGT